MYQHSCGFPTRVGTSQRLCALVPRPGTHRVKYHGVCVLVLLDCSLVVFAPLGVEAVDDAGPEAEELGRQERSSDSLFVKRRRICRLLWAELLKWTFGVDIT